MNSGYIYDDLRVVRCPLCNALPEITRGPALIRVWCNGNSAPHNLLEVVTTSHSERIAVEYWNEDAKAGTFLNEKGAVIAL